MAKRKARTKQVIDLVRELQKLPPYARISIEFWNRNTEDWDIAVPDICKHKDSHSQYVVTYMPEDDRG